jgi:hypothetical protein
MFVPLCMLFLFLNGVTKFFAKPFLFGGYIVDQGIKKVGQNIRQVLRLR